MKNGLLMLAEINPLFLNTNVLAVLTLYVLFSVNSANTAIGRG
jgi:hypothetical protein